VEENLPAKEGRRVGFFEVANGFVETTLRDLTAEEYGEIARSIRLHISFVKNK
jgi:hypothetical protein